MFIGIPHKVSYLETTYRQTRTLLGLSVAFTTSCHTHGWAGTPSESRLTLNLVPKKKCQVPGPPLGKASQKEREDTYTALPPSNYASSLGKGPSGEITCQFAQLKVPCRWNASKPMSKNS